uniref:HTH CENPB-type domain-containing protein n=1 Tax=Meloidogyne hapla TaxID=6305 RepID=A0A1I8BI59_MELHA
MLPVKPPKFRRKRTLITLATKKSIIEASIGKTSSEVGKLFDLPSSTIRSILQSKNIILGALERGTEERRSCIQPVKNENLDSAIFDWVKTTRERGFPLSGPILKEKAIEFAKQFNIENFKASDGWLEKFKHRHSISFSNKEEISNGFAYTKHRLSVDGRRTYWRCERRSSLTGCHGRAVTIGNEEGQPVLLTVHHNHPPSEKYGPLTGGTGAHGWAVGGDVVGTSSNTTPPASVRGVPTVPKISRCDIAKNNGENTRKRRFGNSQFPFTFPPFIGDGEPPNLTMAEEPNSPQNFSSYSTMEQFLNSHSDNNLPPFLESAEDNFNNEITIKRPRLEETGDGAELGELYLTEGFFDPNNEDGNNNEGLKQLDQLKKEWEEFTSYDPSQPSTSSLALAAVRQSADALIEHSNKLKINSSSPSFGGTALIREKSQLDFLLQLPANTDSRQELSGFTCHQHGCGTTPNGIKQMPTAFEWENDPRTVELRKQLNDALDRERTFQHKVQKTTDELLDARAEIDVINAKNERLEKRLKNSNDELINLREQLDQSMDHRETLERQQFELNLKESRKRAELQRELEAKEDEMEEMRIQYQRKIRNLESALDDAQIENSSLKQKKAAWQRNSQSASMNGSLLDLAQNTSTENRTLRRKLAKALSLLQNSQINFDKDSFEGNSQLRKQNLGSTVFSSVCGGSEFDDLEDMLLEEDGKDLQKEEGNISILKPKEERGSRETSLLAIENDGANSDTVEDSSCGAEEM